jgi:hypothetical protein
MIEFLYTPQRGVVTSAHCQNGVGRRGMVVTANIRRVTRLDAEETGMTEALTITIPGSIEPMERHDLYGGPLGKALWRAGRVGRVVGGGTAMSLRNGCEIEGCDLDVDVKDLERGLAVIRDVLVQTPAPRGTTVYRLDPEQLLLVVRARGQVRAPRRQIVRPSYPWEVGELVGYRLGPTALALLHVLQSGDKPVVRVLDWVGARLPPQGRMRQLVGRKDARHATGKRLYALGWLPVSFRLGLPRKERQPDPSRFLRPGVVVKPPARRDGFVAFGSWPEFDQTLGEVFGLVPVDAATRLRHDLGIIGPHLAVWEAPRRVHPAEAARLFAAYIRKDKDRPAVPPTPALRQFVSEIKSRYAAQAEQTGVRPWREDFRASEGFMIIALAADRAEEFRAEAVELCRAHGLTCYDPQANKVYSPGVRPSRNSRVRRQRAVKGARPETA